MTYPTPTESGWYFARHVDWDKYEPVEVIDDWRNRSGLAVLSVGHSCIFDFTDLVWGPRITMPEDLAVEEAGR